MKFCVQLGKNATETHHMLQDDFKEECISRSQCGTRPPSRVGRRSPTSLVLDVQQVREVLKSDSRLSIQVIADTLNLSKYVVHGILMEDLQMRKVCAKLVPKVSTEEQKEVPVLRSEELMSWCPSLPIALSWRQVTFFCSPDRKES
ncbi:protein GVQW3-like [Parasteatoda tepidariorum]|uniref:protein GVQW3-like n=1 Tax=Parasteatoda tepidariorum TaxID=114398 RepID=UPI0039BC2464